MVSDVGSWRFTGRASIGFREEFTVLLFSLQVSRGGFGLRLLGLAGSKLSRTYGR